MRGATRRHSRSAGLTRPATSMSHWRAPSSTPPATGAGRTRWESTGCRSRANAPLRIGSPMASPMCWTRRAKAMPGKTTLVVGSGHSAINAALNLLTLQDQVPGTRIVWALRRNRIEKLLGGGLNDQLPERGALGSPPSGRSMPVACRYLLRRRHPHRAYGRWPRRDGQSRPDHHDPDGRSRDRRHRLPPRSRAAFGSRIAIDPATEAPPALSPLIDPNFHSCGTVRPHGVDELTHPEPGFYIAGAKSYGRAPTFLMADRLRAGALHRRRACRRFHRRAPGPARPARDRRLQRLAARRQRRRVLWWPGGRLIVLLRSRRGCQGRG